MSLLHPPGIPAFVPRLPWVGADLQTLRNSFRGAVATPPAGTRVERITVAMPPSEDGSVDRLAARLERPANPSPLPSPLVVLIHGLGGSEDSNYLDASSAHLLEGGANVLRLNLRGAGASRPLCRQQYHAGRAEDLRDFLAGLPAALEEALGAEGPAVLSEGLVLVGFSLGGNMLLKFLAEYGATTPGLRAGVSISAPIDLGRSSRRILERRNVVYHRHLLRGMLEEARLAGDSITPEEWEVLDTVESILEFDDRLVAPRNGFAGAADYYARCSAIHFLPEIRVPTWVIHALDDPWIPGAMYADFAWRDNPSLLPILPGGGGHVGFHARGTRVPWHDQCLDALLAALARESREGAAEEATALGAA